MVTPSSRYLTHDFPAYKGLSLRELGHIILFTTGVFFVLFLIVGFLTGFVVALGCIGFLFGFIGAVTLMPKPIARFKAGKPHGYLKKAWKIKLASFGLIKSPYLHYQGVGDVLDWFGGIMFKYWQKVDALNHLNRLLVIGCGVLLLIIAGLLVVLIKAPKQMEFWLSPAMMSNGGLIKAGEVPDEYVHGFATALIPTLNTWSKAGREEFAKNIQAFHYYFTPRHQALMTNTLNAFQDAQLFNRTQVASLYRFLEPGDIKRIAENAWEVHLMLRITQRINNKNPMVIADKVVDYHIRVVKTKTSKLLNPFQLALDGYTKPEHLVRDLLSKDLSGEHHEA